MVAEVFLEPTQVSGGVPVPRWSCPTFCPDLWYHEILHLTFFPALDFGASEES